MSTSDQTSTKAPISKVWYACHQRDQKLQKLQDEMEDLKRMLNDARWTIKRQEGIIDGLHEETEHLRSLNDMLTKTNKALRKMEGDNDE